LTLLALGARGNAAEMARHRGLKAARLAAVKADMRRRLHEPGLSLDQLASQHGLSPRYLRALFAAEDTSFSDTLLLQRLTEAHRCLTAPEKAGLTITDIAYAVGFNDLSYFNRAFKRRFGLTPRDVRQGLHL
jgi:AraC-like DNA-binding protein